MILFRLQGDAGAFTCHPNNAVERARIKDVPTQRLGYQGLMSLGVLENPLTGDARVDLNHARMLIDDLAMIAEKTRGNLDEEESEHLMKTLRDLRHQFEASARELEGAE